MPAEADSLEALFLAHIRQQRAERQQRFVSQIGPRLRASATERQTLFAELAGVDLRAARTVAEQADQLQMRTAVRLKPEELVASLAREGAEFPNAGSMPAVPEK
jgi:hypothetical protein